MKTLMINLLLTGCITSGMKTLEVKYLPGDCAKATEEKIAEYPPLQGIEMYINSIGSDNYEVFFLKGNQLVGRDQVDMKEFDDRSVPMECTVITKQNPKDQ